MYDVVPKEGRGTFRLRKFTFAISSWWVSCFTIRETFRKFYVLAVLAACSRDVYPSFSSSVRHTRWVVRCANGSKYRNMLCITPQNDISRGKIVKYWIYWFARKMRYGEAPLSTTKVWPTIRHISATVQGRAHTHTHTQVGKRVVDFIILLVLTELFFAMCYGWGATGENGSKIGVFKACGSVCAKLSHRRERHRPIFFARILRPMIFALQVCRWKARSRLPISVKC